MSNKRSFARRREPFVSLARIFLACSVTPIEGLLRFPKVWDAHDETLGGLAPFRDLWVPLRLARTVCADLGRLGELESLLDWDSRLAWTVEDREERALLHNWRIPLESLSAEEYSTWNMLSASFRHIELLPAGTQIRTLLATRAAEAAVMKVPTYRRDGPLPSDRYQALYEKLIEWTVYEMASHLDRRPASSKDAPVVPLTAAQFSAQPVPAPDDDGDDARPELQEENTSRVSLFGHRLTRLYVYDVLALLTTSVDPADELSRTLPSDSLSHLPSLSTVRRLSMLDDLMHSSRDPDDSTERLYLLDAMSRLVARQHLDAELLHASAQQADQAAREAVRLAEAARYGELQRRVDKIESDAENEVLRVKQAALRDRLGRERLDALEAELERLTLVRRGHRDAIVAPLLAGDAGRWWLVAAAAFVAGIALGIGLALAGSGEL